MVEEKSKSGRPGVVKAHFRCFVLGYNNGGVSLQGRKKGWNSFQGNYGRKNPYYESGGYGPQPLNLQEKYENVETRDIQEAPQIRHTPYTVSNKRKAKWHYESSTQITVWRDRKHLDRKMAKNIKNKRNQGNWFKITVPNGKKYEKEWLVNSIQSHCSVSFTPVDFHYIKNRARFFVQRSTVASSLKDVSNKIYDKENEKICIYVNQSAAPFSVRNKLEPEEMEQLELTVKKRYDVTQKALHLQKLRFDPDLMDHAVDIILNRRNCMSATLQIIEKNFPELLSLNLRNNKLYQLDGLADIIQKTPTVKILNLSKNELKSAWEVSKMKGLKLEELWLEGNPLCDTFPDQSSYVSAIRDYFPKLLRLDGQELPTPVVIEVGYHAFIMPCKEFHKRSDVMKNLVLQFLQEYYFIYDYGDRQSLLSAYHDKSFFSLSIPFNPKDPTLSCLYELYKESRNMKKLKDPILRIKLLKHTKQDVVRALCMLPRTQHDLNSFVVDMWVQTDTMLCFSVQGLLKEVQGGSQGSVRAFTRTFVTTPEKYSSLCIMNDELFVRIATPSETQNIFSVSVPTPISISVSTLFQKQKGNVQSFFTQSRVNPQFSQK
ncbi:nuclear RNA export factor 2-like [Erinaceus europaeus]|uniref:Nuclear RNA export factor 2-like n=1 Tax=Erinaceus europaeus TaxID=9365 RepID=A0A1S3AM05_ERIEU|nr:nuclear RNA export factor 2-like [Erinaceus europaeus]